LDIQAFTRPAGRLLRAPQDYIAFVPDAVQRSVDPAEVGIDMLSLLASGRFDVPLPSDTGPGLVHEPSPGEAPPEGYVEAHEEAGELDLPFDPEAGPRPLD